MHHPTRTTPRLVACLLAAALAPACTTTPKDGPGADGGYRTIRAEPLRNIEAAIAANDKGLAHLDAGEVGQAELAFKKALDNDDSFGPAHNHLGKVYFLKGNYYLAAHEFDKAIQLMPRQAAPHNNLGLTLLQGDKLDEAVEAFRAATTLDPGRIEYQANLARALVQRGEESEEVITLLRSVAENDQRVDWRVWANHRLGLMGLK